MEKKAEFLSLKKFDRDMRIKLDLTQLSVDDSMLRRLSSPEILRPSLALTGFRDYLTSGNILLFGETEVLYLNSLNAEKQIEFYDHLISYKITSIILPSVDISNLPYFINKCQEMKVCLYRSGLNSTKIIHFLSDYLDFVFAPKINVHGTLIDVSGIGILITGKSGIGKSEIALDLVERGHRLVADDMVICTQKSKIILMGAGRAIADHFLEIRGIGLVDVKRLFGIRSGRIQKRIEVVLELVEWDPTGSYDRTGLDPEYVVINEVKLPKVKLPINPGKNITVLIETIALNHLCKILGFNPAQEFNDRLIKSMEEKSKEDKEFNAFLEDDYE